MKKAFVILWAVGIVCMSAPCQAGLEIIDGGDSETMRLLFPDSDAETLNGLERMRQQRLESEARCKISEEFVMLSLISSLQTENNKTGLAFVEEKKKQAYDFIEAHNIKVHELLHEAMEVHDRGRLLRGADDYLAMYNYVVLTPKRGDFEGLKAQVQKNGLEISIMPHRICADADNRNNQ